MNEQQTIMVVEDDADIAEAVATTLEDDGYAVIVATNGQEALDKLRDGALRPRLILLDLMMPVMDGWQFRAAQTADPGLAQIPVILLSAHVDVRAAANQIAAVGWLKKPVDLGELLTAIEHPAVG